MATITSIKFGTDKIARASGGTITAHVKFDEDVQVTGTPLLNLSLIHISEPTRPY